MLGAGSIEHRELIYYTVSKSTTFEPRRAGPRPRAVSSLTLSKVKHARPGRSHECQLTHRGLLGEHMQKHVPAQERGRHGTREVAGPRWKADGIRSGHCVRGGARRRRRQPCGRTRRSRAPSAPTAPGASIAHVGQPHTPRPRHHHDGRRPGRTGPSSTCPRSERWCLPSARPCTIILSSNGISGFRRVQHTHGR
jgi:hypothetical protein